LKVNLPIELALDSNRVMRFLEINEIWEWCGARSIALEEGAKPADDPSLGHHGRWLYATGERSGRESQVAADCVRALGTWDECLLWITLVGVWPSGEDWPTVYAWRGARGEKRSVDVAPGYLFAADEEDSLREVLIQVFENAWDAYVLPASRVAAHPIRARVSHDEWVEVQGKEPVKFGVAAV
jgi:hypothetical protein